MHDNDERRRAYEAYLRSGTWTAKRDARMRMDSSACRGCGSTDDLHVHHRTYERFGGDELMEDLVTVCESCHRIVHRLHGKGRETLAAVTDRVLATIRSASAPDGYRVLKSTAKKKRKNVPMSDAERAERLTTILAKHADLEAACDVGPGSTRRRGGLLLRDGSGMP